MIIDALYRLSEMRSSNIAFLYFSFYEKRFTQDQICWAAKNYLIIGSVQLFSLSAVVAFEINRSIKKEELKEISILPIVIAITLCILFTLTNIYLYVYSDGFLNPEEQKPRESNLNYLHSVESSDLEESVVNIKKEYFGKHNR